MSTQAEKKEKKDTTINKFFFMTNLHPDCCAGGKREKGEILPILHKNIFTKNG